MQVLVGVPGVHLHVPIYQVIGGQGFRGFIHTVRHWAGFLRGWCHGGVNLLVYFLEIIIETDKPIMTRDTHSE